MARVLLIDDDADLCEALAEWLMLHGHAVRTLPDGRSAVDTARDFAPDLVLLDGLLPDAPGPVLAERLLAAGSPLVIYLSGLEPARLPLGSTVLSKPLDLEALERALEGCVRARA